DFDFGGPLTKEQAAQVLFKDGKVPSEAKFVKGPGENSWTLSADSMESWQATVNNLQAHKQTVSGDEIEDDWESAPAPPKRRDLDNNFGFKITKHYPVDNGKFPASEVDTSEANAHGFEVVFDKAVTEAEVIDKVFQKQAFNKGRVQLEPTGA